MKIDNELVAVYSHIDYYDSKNKIYPYDEALVPLKDWCECNGSCIYNIYLDIEDRQALIELLEDAKAFKFKSLIVIKLENLAETYEEAESIVHELSSYGIDVKAINRNKYNSKQIL